MLKKTSLSCLMIIVIIGLALAQKMVEDDELNRMIELTEKKLKVIGKMRKQILEVTLEKPEEEVDNTYINKIVYDAVESLTNQGAGKGLNQTEKFVFNSKIITKTAKLSTIDVEDCIEIKTLKTYPYRVTTTGRTSGELISCRNNKYLAIYDYNGRILFDHQSKFSIDKVKFGTWAIRNSVNQMKFVIFSKTKEYQEFQANMTKLNNPDKRIIEYAYDISPTDYLKNEGFNVLNSGNTTDFEIFRRPKFDLGVYGDDSGQIHTVTLNHTLHSSFSMSERPIKKIVQYIGKVLYLTDKSFGRTDFKGKNSYECFVSSGKILGYHIEKGHIIILTEDTLYKYRIGKDDKSCNERVMRWPLSLFSSSKKEFKLINVVSIGSNLWLYGTNPTSPILVLRKADVFRGRTIPMNTQLRLFALIPDLLIRPTDIIKQIETSKPSKSMDMQIYLSMTVQGKSQIHILTHFESGERGGDSGDWYSDLRLPIIGAAAALIFIYQKFIRKSKKNDDEQPSGRYTESRPNMQNDDSDGDIGKVEDYLKRNEKMFTNLEKQYKSAMDD